MAWALSPPLSGLPCPLQPSWAPPPDALVLTARAVTPTLFPQTAPPALPPPSSLETPTRCWDRGPGGSGRGSVGGSAGGTWHGSELEPGTQARATREEETRACTAPLAVTQTGRLRTGRLTPPGQRSMGLLLRLSLAVPWPPQACRFLGGHPGAWGLWRPHPRGPCWRHQSSQRLLEHPLLPQATTSLVPTLLSPFRAFGGPAC